jgi:hypothetical protein
VFGAEVVDPLGAGRDVWLASIRPKIFGRIEVPDVREVPEAFRGCGVVSA